jgi:hypothetical protein
MKWEFTAQPSAQVETEVTQRDHFNNDDVNLSETIVREAVQNSLDADDNEPDTNIRVTFNFLNKSNGLKTAFFSKLFKNQIDHAKIAGLDTDSLDFDNPEALIIEDFGTTGLSGSINQKDENHFSDFWRRHGKSHKSGSKRGRWGLGKLVYSTSSRLGAFFGVTKRKGENETYLMGQTVLNTRLFKNRTYPPHSFFSDWENEKYDPIPVPIKSASIQKSFIDNFQLQRKMNAGLSIIIPFPDKSFNKNSMLAVGIENYFYPILTGKLTLQFDEIIVNKDNIRELAHIYTTNKFEQVDLLFDFIEEIQKTTSDELISIDPGWQKDILLNDSHFLEEELKVMRKKFTQNETVGLAIPITVNHKKNGSKKSEIKVFIKKPFDLAKGIDIYVRGGLTLPAEEKFKNRKALGVMIAEHKDICDLLGDAENAAHTQWIQNTEKLNQNYIAPGHIVKAVKQSIVSLYKILAEVVEERNEEALLDFFSYRNPDNKRIKSRTKRPPKPPKDIKRSKKRINISQTEEGFRLTNAEGMTEEALPYEQKVRVAYDISRGNPFAKGKYSPIDFTVGKGGSIDIDECTGVTVLKSAQNEWVLRFDSIPFRFSVSGFDTNRDLIMKLPEGKKHVEEN